MSYHLPRFIGICGNPKSGKSLVQQILHKVYGVTPVDDGAILRKFAMDNMGATHDQVHTQEGKASLAFWPNGDSVLNAETGKQMTWRQVLGELGKKLEVMLGEWVMPMTACAPLVGPGPFSFGSVRKTQGGYFKKHGGLIIEVSNSLAPPTGNDFDVYDRSFIDYTIYNEALARGYNEKSALRDLEESIHTIVVDYSARRIAA